jgi:DNA-binding PadR family transcriptional regulator
MRHVVSRTIGSKAKPLSEPVFLILTSLADQPRHGYALLKDVENLSGHQIRLSTGTLYGAIHRLLNDGWIERFEQEDVSRDKQAYRLTRAGRMRLQLELDRLKNITKAASARLRASEA